MRRRRYDAWDVIVAVVIFFSMWGVLAVVFLVFRACMGDSAPTHIEF